MKINIDRVISFGALIISFATVILLVYEIRLSRKAQYASVMPYLHIVNFEMNRPGYRIVLLNDGLGPAFIESVKVIYYGKEYLGDLQDFLLASKIRMDSIKFTYTNVSEGRIIPAGAQFAMIAADGDLANSLRLLKIFNPEKMEIITVYKSVFDERWVTSSTSGTRKLD
jgi:hypothetical protein